MSVQSLSFFDIWQAGYGGATVRIYQAGTTTLANVYTDTLLTVAAANPQTLQSQLFGSYNYGKWVAPIYVNESVEVEIGGQHDTGVIYPVLTDLIGEDASKATVLATGTTWARDLDDALADMIHVLQMGDLGVSAATNTTRITAAIGVAQSAGGGFVQLPAGTYSFNAFTIPANVILVGAGRYATVLQGQIADNLITLSGDRAGLKSLTIDGVNLTAGSVGLYSVSQDESVLIDVRIRRFETGIHQKGGQRAQWSQLHVSGCATGAKLHGDDDTGDTGLGAEWSYNEWSGGYVDLCTTAGIELSYEDNFVQHNTFYGIRFDSNTGTAFKVNGARQTDLYNPSFEGNTTNFAIDDDSDTDKNPDNEVVGFRVHSGPIEDGTSTFDGTCQDIVFTGITLKSTTFNLVSPENAILVRDSTEESFTVSGVGTQFVRHRRSEHIQVSGQTTGASWVDAFTSTIEAGELVYVEYKAAGTRQNGEAWALIHYSAVHRREGDELAYDNQVANFTVGDILTGATSAATARIVADADAGATGTLTLKDIVGEFENNEQITDVAGGDALANGVLVPQSTTEQLADTAIIAKSRVGNTLYDANMAITAVGFDVEVRGEASHTVDWVVDIDIVRT